jgi:uncharacterized phage protein gp47/JayE
MYESQTEDIIETRMLSHVSDTVDKREGSVIYDATKPTSIEIMLLYAMCDYFLTNTFGDTAERGWLIERAKERGLSPTPASYAKVQLSFTPATLPIAIGSRFSDDDVNYAVTTKISDGLYYALCETAGTAGNKAAGNVIPITNLSGLKTATLTEVTIPGEDAEATETFRARYLASFDSQAYGGNIADYREKMNAIDGVGGCKIYPVWNGGGTVKVVFITSEYNVPTADFVNTVQTMLDPVNNQGQGVGIAPIGHSVTVKAAASSAVAISFTLSFSSGSYDTYEANIKTVIDAYFLELNKTWESTQHAKIDDVSNTGLTIRLSQIEVRILDISGITDIQNVKLNGNADNLTLDVDQLAVRGIITNGS